MKESVPGPSAPVTTASLVEDLTTLGLQSGQTVLVHASLSALGWVCGGSAAVIDALQQVVGSNGTIVMPSHSPDNSEPSNWINPAVPEAWYEHIRSHRPPYRPDITPTRGIGVIPECFRNYPEVRRSAHPQLSFTAWGNDADFVTDDHELVNALGETSPLARVYDLDGDVLFLGTDYDTNTSLHLAEYRADIENGTEQQGAAVLENGERTWVEWEELAMSDRDFPECGAAFERERPGVVDRGRVGVADAKLFPQRAVVDFGVEWLEEHRE